MPKESSKKVAGKPSRDSYSSSSRRTASASSSSGSASADRKKVPARRLRDEEEARQEEDDPNSREANCPPCFPIIRFAISDLNSPPKKITAFLALSAWAAVVVILIVNFVAAWFPLVEQWSDSDARSLWLKLMLVSACHMIVVPFVSFFLLFWSVYWACTSGSSLVYLGFFICYVIAVIYCCVMLVGIPVVGGCGILTSIRLLLTGVWVSLLCHLIVSFCWVLLAVFFIAILIINYHNFRADNGNLVALKDTLVGKLGGLKTKLALSGVRSVV